MNSKHDLLALLACLLTCACATPRVVQDHQRDSVSVIIRDSVRFVDSLVLVSVPQGSDKAVIPDSDTSRLQTDIAESVAWVAAGQLHHTLKNKDAAIIPVTIKVPERLHIEKPIRITRSLNAWRRFSAASLCRTILQSCTRRGMPRGGL